MRIKRFALISLLAFLCLCLSAITAPASTRDMVQYMQNGGFEELLATGVPKGWNLQSGASAGKEISAETKVVHDGKQSLKMTTESGGVWLSQKVAGLRGDTDYTIDVWTFIKNEGGKGAVKLEFSTVTDSVTENLGSQTFSVEGVSRTWEKKTFPFKTPMGATNARVYIRILNGGEYYWDDITLTGEAPPDGEPIPCADLLSMYGTGGELIKNGDFETLGSGGTPSSWTPTGSSWTAPVSYDTTIFHGGKGAVKITTATGGQPWVRQRVAVSPSTKYQASVWVRKDQVPDVAQGAIRFKFEGLDKTETYMSRDTISSALVPENDRQWVQFRQDYTTPDNCYFVDLYLRLHSTGTIWFDDMSFYQVEEAPLLHVTTDSIFYYPDQKNGTATATLYEPACTRVDFALTDDETVLYEQPNTEFFEGTACFAYNISLLTEKKKAYRIRAVAKDADGNAMQTQTAEIFLYDRPKNVDKNSNYLNEDGSVFIPTIGYHVPITWYENCAEMGVNVVQIPYGYAYIYPDKPETLRGIMADLKKYNLKGIICLYYGMVPATHPNNIESTRRVVEDFKDDPSVFGYAVMDEPFAGIPNAYADAPYYLKDAYKLIRQYDDKHPVYNLEASIDLFSETAKYCDVLAYDPYPSNQHEPATHVRTSTEMATLATRGIKPTYAVFQAFLWRDYFPTITEIRSFWYQALLANSHGEGYFKVEKAYDGLDIDKTELWPGLVTFAADEQSFAYDVFGYGDYPLFNAALLTDYEYKSVLKDRAVYMVVLNRTNTTKEVEIPLLSNNRYVLADGAVTCLYGSDSAAKDGEILRIALTPRQVNIYKIEAPAITAESLAQSRFTDLEGYAWAEGSINTLDAQGIINAMGEHTYAPAQPITRADFAMYLVNTLSLSARKYDITNSFPDVEASAPYARAVAIGKAIGIFAGDELGNFRPDGSITRQDVMVMCTRAMRYVEHAGGAGTLAELAAFSDGNTVSGYAAPAVANMVHSAIIKGNADGTIQPFGNTTRAEAAVIMARISAIAEGL